MKVLEHKAFKQMLINSQDQRLAACERILKAHGIDPDVTRIRGVSQNIYDRPKGTSRTELQSVWLKAQAALIRYLANYGEQIDYAKLSAQEINEFLFDACYASVADPLFDKNPELIRHGADVKARDDFGNLAFRYLVARFDLSQHDEAGNTVFTLAPVVTDDLLSAFLEAGLDINESCDYNGKCSTFWICLAGVASPNALMMMLKHGARVNDRDSSGRTALMECRDRRADAECIKSLLENGADPSIPDVSGDSGLHEAVTIRGRGEEIIMMIEGGADINLRNKEGNTPLHAYAKASIDNAILTILLKNGSDVNAMNREGDTPLHIASGRCGSYDTVKALIAHEADVNAANSVGNTPLHITSLQWDYDTSCNAELLLEKGANLNQRNLAGMTPLLLAAGFDRQLVVRALVEHGADVDLTNAAGQTAYDIAIANGFVETASAINPKAREDYARTPAGKKKQQEKAAIIEKIKSGFLFEKGDREGFWELSWDPSYNPPSYRFYEDDLGGRRTSWFTSDESAIAMIGDESIDSHHLKKDPSRDLAKEAEKKAREGPKIDSATFLARLGKYKDLCSFALPLIHSEDDFNRLMSALDAMHAHQFGFSDRHLAMKAMIPQIFEIACRHVHSLEDLLLLCSKTPGIIKNLPEDSEDSPAGKFYYYDLATLKARGLLALNMSEFVGSEPIMIGGKEIELK